MLIKLNIRSLIFLLKVFEKYLFRIEKAYLVQHLHSLPHRQSYALVEPGRLE